MTLPNKAFAMYRCLCLFICSLYLFPIDGKAQCDPVIINGWQLVSPQIGEIIDQTYEIEIEAPANIDSYSLVIFSEYELEWDDVPPLIHFEVDGELQPGLNTIEVTIPSSVIWDLDVNPLWHYFSAELQTNCTDGSESGWQKFYLSSHSLLNDAGFQCESNFFNVVLPMPDGVDVPYEAFLNIETENDEELVESLEVFVDIGHTFAGDFSITLESPAGTLVTLLEHPNDLGNEQSFSVLFQDGAPEIVNFDEEIEAGPRGIYSPEEPLFTFNNEPINGLWKITVTDHLGMDDGLLAGICMSINGSPCAAFISGSVFYDLNETGVEDGNDQPFPFPFIFNSLDESPVAGNSMGTYIDCSSLGNGLFSLMNPPSYYAVSNVGITVNEDDWLSGVNFPLIGIPGFYDLTIDVFSPTPDVPGFSNTYYVQCENVGTECIDNAQIEVTFPDNMEINAVYGAPGSYTSGSTLIYNPSSICPLESQTFTIVVSLSDTTLLGTQIEVYAVVEPLSTDETPHNNEYTFNSIVVGAFDPNDKLVDQEIVGPSFMESDSPLRYMVRFQNTGTYYAEDVVIVDTLSQQLDLMTFDLLESSHPVEVSFQNNIAYFNFNNIMLPDSTSDLEGSMGYVRFAIQPRDEFNPGQTIFNIASIFFDFNAPIITNTVSTIFLLPLGTSPTEPVDVKAWPNPLSDLCYFDWPDNIDIESLEVFDSMGRRILVHQLEGRTEYVINSSEWSKGIYTVRFNSSEQTSALRLVRQ